MTTRILPAILAGLFTAVAAWAQPRNTELMGDHTLKVHANTNPYEWGLGASYQLYTRQSTGIQANVDVLFPEGYGLYDGEGEGIRGAGIRLNPEWRYYMNRKARNNMTSFFVGAGPLIKTMWIHQAEWRWKQNDLVAGPYSRLDISTYRNISAGLMGRIGVEAYIGYAQRLVFEASYGFGLTQNWVRTTGDGPRLERQGGVISLDELSVSNQRSGFYPYIDMRCGLGYRLFSQRRGD